MEGIEFHDVTSMEYRKYDAIGANRVHRLKLKPAMLYSTQNTSDLSGERIETFNIDLTGDDLYVLDGYLLLYVRETIRIYRYDSMFNCTRLRTISSHLLIFLIKKRAVNRRCRLFFYDVLLHLIKNNERNYDSKLRDIMHYMCIDWLDDVRLCSEGALCIYRNGESRLYDHGLRVLAEDKHLVFGRNENVVKNQVQTIRISKKGVEIIHIDRSFRDLLTIEGIKQHIILRNALFLLTGNSIKVLRFED